jgi:putative transposase
MEMRWRQYRREATHWELFVSLDALLKAAPAFFARYNQCSPGVLSSIGAHAAYLSWLYLEPIRKVQRPER